MNNQIIDILSWIAVIIFIGSSLPQIIKLYQEKSSKDISLLLWLMIDISVALILMRAMMLKDTIFIVNYIANFILITIIIVQIIYYRRKQSEISKAITKMTK